MHKGLFSRQELLEVLTKNAEKHEKDFRIAIEIWHTDVMNDLSEHRRKLKKFHRKFRDLSWEEMADPKSDKMHMGHALPFRPKPVNATKEYERAIRMLEMTTRENVELTADEFRNYVEDDWEWSREAKTINSMYLSKTKAI